MTAVEQKYELGQVIATHPSTSVVARAYQWDGRIWAALYAPTGKGFGIVKEHPDGGAGVYDSGDNLHHRLKTQDLPAVVDLLQILAGDPPLLPWQEQVIFASERQEDDSDLLGAIRNGAWLDQQHFEPLSYHVDRLIPEGLTLLVGAPKIGKSWFVQQMLLAVAAGGYALGAIAVEQRPVLYLALEDGDRRLRDRSRKLLGNEAIPAAFQYLTCVQPGLLTATIEAWFDKHGRHRPLVVLDTLGKVMPPAKLGESAYQRDYRIGSQLKQLVDNYPGAALLVNHHVRKADSEDFIDSVSGTHGLAGSADTIVVLSRKRQQRDGVIKVTGRDVEEGEYAVVFEPDSAWRIDGRTLTEAAANLSQRQAAGTLDQRSLDILATVNEHPGGITPAQVAPIVGIDAAQVRVYLGRLADTGRIIRAKRGLYTPVTSVTSVANNPLEVTHQTHVTHPLGGPESGEL